MVVLLEREAKSVNVLLIMSVVKRKITCLKGTGNANFDLCKNQKGIASKRKHTDANVLPLNCALYACII